MDSTIFCFASRSPRSIRFARSTSSWAVSSRTLPMSLRKSCSESVVMSGFRSSAVCLRRLPRFGSARSASGRRRLRGIDVVDHLHALALEVAVELLDVALVDVDLGQRLGDLAVGDDALGLTLGDEVLDFLELLKLRDQHRLATSSFLVCVAGLVAVAGSRGRHSRSATPCLEPMSAADRAQYACSNRSGTFSEVNSTPLFAGVSVPNARSRRVPDDLGHRYPQHGRVQSQRARPPIAMEYGSMSDDTAERGARRAREACSATCRTRGRVPAARGGDAAKSGRRAPGRSEPAGGGRARSREPRSRRRASPQAEPRAEAPPSARRTARARAGRAAERAGRARGPRLGRRRRGGRGGDARRSARSRARGDARPLRKPRRPAGRRLGATCASSGSAPTARTSPGSRRWSPTTWRWRCSRSRSWSCSSSAR